MVSAGDVQVAYGDEGTGDPFLLVHGSTGGRTHWASVAPLLAARYRVVTPEYAGGGRTVDQGGPLDVDALGEQVLAVADAVGADRFHLAGWSLGAVVATVVAAGHQDRVRSLALVCGWAATDARMRFTMDLWARLLRTDRELFARYALADGASADFFDEVGEGADDLVPLLAAQLSAGADRHAELDGRVDIAERLLAVTAPTLVVGARDDRFVPVEHSRHLAATIAGARLVELDCGHLVPSERGPELAALLAAHAGRSAGG
jgi:3-oxoadipate enol-lactonase